ncbi:YceI family protein [Arsukibacterium sp.]|uniref:YceI family protein n=1 Tax=Arsukibacterium sp. TaxID=1977258 RepID=UPI00299F2328|nr:YceI family protein [Arsukibacterium sp.]MDX1677306.1 YceI family protein [Arsukibacterium sp.]
MKKMILAAIATAGFSFGMQAADYKIDTEDAHAFIQFKISHLGFSWLHGRFNTFEGRFSYDADKLAESKVSIVIDTSSVDSNHAERDKHLRSEDFLNVSKHPQASFKSTGVVANDDGSFNLHGDLTLNGITRGVVIVARKIGEGADPWGGYRAGFSGTTSFELKDFGINYDLGPASSRVYLDLNVEGIRQ